MKIAFYFPNLILSTNDDWSDQSINKVNIQEEDYKYNYQVHKNKLVNLFREKKEICLIEKSILKHKDIVLSFDNFIEDFYSYFLINKTNLSKMELENVKEASENIFKEYNNLEDILKYFDDKITKISENINSEFLRLIKGSANFDMKLSINDVLEKTEDNDEIYEIFCDLKCFYQNTAIIKAFVNNKDDFRFIYELLNDTIQSENDLEFTDQFNKQFLKKYDFRNDSEFLSIVTGISDLICYFYGLKFKYNSQETKQSIIKKSYMLDYLILSIKSEKKLDSEKTKKTISFLEFAEGLLALFLKNQQDFLFKKIYPQEDNY
ncbi:hypothetical protein A0H76_170 [Hepatospora eriocheir]|uniref:Uncharacterized protein n=1 Tax=Hepatospora eriocheir TaxID=1081669 RepID=A0A1X0QJ45_9MICR|nr:hypothetical protein A0H76_170 [Hepatospora eriocheir]